MLIQFARSLALQVIPLSSVSAHCTLSDSQTTTIAMEEDKHEEDGVVVVELKISMHCNACERSVANIISNVKGVEKFTTDMRRHRVVITGKIDTKKVMKKLKKKTGKRVELLPPLKQQQVTKAELEPSEEQGLLMKELVLFGGSHWRGCDFTTMFSDENPNACLVM